MATIERSQRLEFTDPPETVIRMLTDPAFYEAKYAASGFEELEVTPEADAQDFAILARYQTKPELPLPAWARKALPETVRVEQRDEWHTTERSGRIDLSLQGAPVRIDADLRLQEDGGNAVTCIDWRISCNLPLVGGRIAELLADDVCSKALRDHEYGRSHSADYRA